MTGTRILIGDSHASGLAAAAARVGRPFAAVESMSGQRTRTIAESGWLRAHAAGADEVWIVSSGNDRAPDDLGPPVRSLLEQAQGARVVWLGPPVALRSDVDAEHAGTTAKLHRLLAARGARHYGAKVTFIDSRPLTRGGHAPDGVHFTSSGYGAWLAGAEESLVAHSRRNLAIGVSIGAVGVLAAVFVAVQARR